MKGHRFVPIASLATVLTFGCGSDPAAPGGTNPPAQTGQVGVADNRFSPSRNQVIAGATVTWTWNGNNPHNVTFDDAAVGNSTTKTSGTFSQTFGQAGSFTYYCTVHGRGMSGEVVVE